MPFEIIRHDITQLKVDAIVNAANTQLQPGGGVCGAIYKAAGYHQLQDATQSLGPINTSEAVITPGFNLPAKHIIHTAGPIYKDGQHNEAQLLSDAYLNSLKLASKHNLSSIAFPLLSSGIYGYPKEEALKIATDTIQDYLKNHDLDVYLVIFDKDSFEISKQLKSDIQSYIDQHYVDQFKEIRYRQRLNDYAYTSDVKDNFELDEPFSSTLFRMIDERGLSDVEVYKAANLDRKLFSKIRTREYLPSKRTICALAIALKLNLKETNYLLKKAGYTLSNSQYFDVILTYFITHRDYNLFKINEVLFTYDQPLLGK